MQAITGAVDRFTDEMAGRELLQVFPRLTDKVDVDHVESIDPTTYSIKVLRKDGSEVGKIDLSAGDTQGTVPRAVDTSGL
jgi:hypothetical protein